MCQILKDEQDEQDGNQLNMTMIEKKKAYTILIVDDDINIQNALSQILSNAGYQIYCASDGVQAMKQYNEHLCDLVVTDIVMPEIEGLEFIQNVRRINPSQKIIAISGGGLNKQDYLADATLFGVNATLNKPFSAEDLLAEIHKILT